MVALTFDQFLGERPGRHPQKLDQAQAQVARNTRLVSQALEPFYGLSDERNTDLASSPRTIFRDRDGNWLEFSELTYITNSIVPDDQHDRVFFTNSSGPRVSDKTRRLSGSGPYPGASLRLGVPDADNAPSVTISQQGTQQTNQGQNDQTDIAFLVTIVNSYDEEGPPSPASDVLSVYPDAEITIDLPSTPTGDYDLSSWRVYRNTDGVWQFVDQVAISTSSVTYTFNENNIGQEVLETENWFEPPSDIEGLIAVNGAFLAAFRENEVLFSLAGIPSAWPPELRQSVDYRIRALGSFGNTLVIMTDGPVYLAEGASPGGLALVETNLFQAVETPESVVSLPGSVAYASPDGLVNISSGNTSIATTGVFTDREWDKVDPSSIRATHWQGVYMATFDGKDGVGAFMFDPNNAEVGVIWLDSSRVSAVYNHEISDRFFFVPSGGTTIREWEGDDQTTLSAFRWRSRPVDVLHRPPINVVQVRADNYPITVRVFADDTEQASVDVDTPRPVRIGGARRAMTYSIEVEGSYRTYSVALATTLPELRGS